MDFIKLQTSIGTCFIDMVVAPSATAAVELDLAKYPGGELYSVNHAGRRVPHFARVAV